jgi:hypothetical protein
MPESINLNDLKSTITKQFLLLYNIPLLSTNTKHVYVS